MTYTQDQITSTDVIKVANIFSGGGYVWGGANPPTGSPLTLSHKGVVILNKQSTGTYCSGYTRAMCFLVATNRGLLKDKSIGQVNQLMADFNIGPLYSKLGVGGIVKLGIGKEYKTIDAQPGDFCQIWRTNGSGHSVIFIDFIKNGNNIVGIKYRSTQSSTGGISDKSEYFSGHGGIIDESHLYFARLNDALSSGETTTTTTISSSTTTTTTVLTDNQSTGRQERTGEDPNNNKNQRQSPPHINNIFKNSYNPESIKMNFPADKRSLEEVASSTGYLPFIWYNSYQISYTDIQYFILTHDGVIPVVKMIFQDSLNLMRDKGMPLDDSKVKIYINPRNKKLKPILLQFKISTFKINGNVYTIAGVLDIDGLYLKQYKSYKSMTSNKALQSISRELGLGFNTNIDDTNDSMTWLNTGQRTYNFINDIINTSYKSDESFLMGYIDYYYHFNYVDLEKELNRNVKEELGISSFGLEQAAEIKDQDKLASLFLTNDKTHENSNTYISKYKVINNSTTISLLEGYFTRVKYYDDITKDLLVFDVDSISSPGDKIILKGAPQSEDFYNKNVNLKYMGKMDIDNTHKNFNYSYIQNVRNISEIEKIQLNIELTTPNYNIYRFQKIQVLITNTPTPSQTGVNNRLSGEWLIINIEFEMNRGSIVQKVKLVKRDLELSPDELKAEKERPKVENKNSTSLVEKTENPTDLKNTDVLPTETTTTTTTILETTTTTTTSGVADNLTYKTTYFGDIIVGIVYNNGQELTRSTYSINYMQNINGVIYTGAEAVMKKMEIQGSTIGFYVDGKIYKSN